MSFKVGSQRSIRNLRMNVLGIPVASGLPQGYRIWSWGYNNYGQLGTDDKTHRSSPVQIISGGTDWVTVAAGYRNSVGIKNDGTLWTWGNNADGQLGDNTIIHRSSPVQTVAGGTNWKQCSAGYSMAAIKTDGTLWTWGRGNSGELGDNTAIKKSSPVQTFSGGTDWSTVTMGSSHAMAIKTNGTLWLWGANNYGQIGDNSSIAKSFPVQTVSGGTNWAKLSKTIGSTVSAAIKTDGTLWLWGRGGTGAMGDNTSIAKSSPVQTIAAGTNWANVATSIHVVATKTDGTLWTWGYSSFGALGDNTIIDKSSPVQTIAGGTNWKDMGVHNFWSVATKTDGTLWMWGRNTYGNLGDTTTTDKSSPIQTIAGGTNWLSPIGAGGNHTIILRT